jgi:hypothetical protein
VPPPTDPSISVDTPVPQDAPNPGESHRHFPFHPPKPTDTPVSFINTASIIRVLI